MKTWIPIIKQLEHKNKYNTKTNTDTLSSKYIDPNISHARLSDNKTERRLRGTYCATFFFTAFCILLRTINYDSQSMNYILFTAALVYSFTNVLTCICTPVYVHQCAIVHQCMYNCSPASANPVLYTLYLYLYTSSSQCKSQFAHKGESSNWGKTRNMGRGL